MKKPKPDCRTCGLCCIDLCAFHGVWAEVTEADCERLGKAWCRRNVLEFGIRDIVSRICRPQKSNAIGAIVTRGKEIATGPLAGKGCYACIALRGSPLQRVSCAVYDRRPEVCRTALQPGQRQCLELRRLTAEYWEHCRLNDV